MSKICKQHASMENSLICLSELCHKNLHAFVQTESNLYRQSRPSPNALRRGAPAGSTSLDRMTRLRNRFPGQPRTLSSSRWRNPIFPPNMDIEMVLACIEYAPSLNFDGPFVDFMHIFSFH